MRRCVTALLISMMLAGGAHAQTPVGAGPSTDWTDVMRLSEGTRMVVVDDRGYRRVGIFEEADDQTVRIRQPRTTATLLRQDVVSVSIREVTGMSRRPAIWRGAAKTGLTGLANGAALGALFGEQIAVAYGALCAVLGGVIAAKKAPSATYSERVIYVRH